MPSYSKMPRGKRVMKVLDAKTKEIILEYATNEDLAELLNFSKTDLKNLCRVMSGDVPSIKGYEVINLGVLRDA
mgnify:CR=1 FL=1